MAGKLLITLLVIAVAIALIKQRGRDAPAPADPAAAAPRAGLSDARLTAYLFLVMMFGLGGFLYFQRWQTDHQELTVTLYREDPTAPVTYTVYRYQLQERSFITTDGVRITLADNERMEVTGL